jgi:hypothetical protein
MLRSILVCAVAGLAFVGSMSERPAEANGGWITTGSGGPAFLTVATSFDVPPYKTACGNPMPKGTVKLRTTYLDPDGVHFKFNAVAHLENTAVTKALDFSQKSTVDWDASYQLQDIGSIHNFAVMVGINGANPGDNVGTMHIACSNPSATVASTPTGTSLTSSSCQDYAPSKLTLTEPNPGQWALMTGPNIPNAPNLISSLYVASRKEDAVAISDMLHHGDNLCSLGVNSPDALYVFNGKGDSSKPVAWPGSCTAYDPKTVAISDDAKGWWAKSGSHVFGLYGLEEDARAVADAATRGRTMDCRAFEGVEPKVHVFHYLH